MNFNPSKCILQPLSCRTSKLSHPCIPTHPKITKPVNQPFHSASPLHSFLRKAARKKTFIMYKLIIITLPSRKPSVKWGLNSSIKARHVRADPKIDARNVSFSFCFYCIMFNFINVIYVNFLVPFSPLTLIMRFGLSSLFVTR